MKRNADKILKQSTKQVNTQETYNPEHCPRCPEGKRANTKRNPNGTMHCNRCGYNWITS